jgi:RNA polymerase sigma-70 factor (ECF subfamily)
MNITDEEILRKFHNPATREQAFNLLMNKYQQRLYNQIRRMLHQHDDTDDVLQEVLVKVWKHLEGFKEHAQLYTWLYRIAMNETFNYLSKKNKRNHITWEAYKSESLMKTENAIMPAADIEARLAHAIACLPDKQKEVFNLRYYDEMSYEAMSELLGTSVGALKASYHHAVKKIEKMLLDH